MTSIAPPAVPQIPYTFAREHGVFVRQDGDRTTLAVRPGISPWALLEARRVIGHAVYPVELTPSEFERDLAETYAIARVDDFGGALPESESLDQIIQGMPQATDLLDVADEAPIVRLINGLIAEAIKRRSSDIHVEPSETGVVVRLRIDGVLNEVARLGSRAAPSLISRLKVMARLDIAERRLPQDGRMSLAIAGKTIDVRVATLPSRHGERVVLRLLDREQQRLDIDSLGMSASVADDYRRILREPNGVVLVTGPTGSGKTTTLYAGLNYLNDKARNILTVEDPIEYAIDGVGQTQVNAKVGLTFAAGLRAILRQDPDIIMVGEIRDRETADIAVQASLTGHLVLSTVHTNDAVGAITRLRDIGIESFLLSSTVKAIIAQRLVRRLCVHCRRKEPVSPAMRVMLHDHGIAAAEAFAAVGCPVCKSTGYTGRFGIYEFVTIEEKLRRLIHDGASERDIWAIAFATTPTLIKAGLDAARRGITSFDEVMRVCRSEESDRGGV